jgi:hypothetical protein
MFHTLVKLNKMSKYVPPHLRNKKLPKEEVVEEKAPEVDMSEDSFPPLGSPAPKPLNKWSGKKFSEMASKLSEVVEREAPAPTPAYVAPMKRVHITADFVEPEDTVPPPPPKGDDEWTLVDKKVRKKKEKTLEDMSSSSDEEDTMWANDQQEEYETCWDGRRY